MVVLIVLLLVLTFGLAIALSWVWASKAEVESDLAELKRKTLASADTTAEANLRVDRLHEALDSVTQGVVITDAAGKVSYRNGFASSFVDARHGDALVERTLDELLAVALTGMESGREVDLTGPPHRLFMLHASPLEVQGEIVGALAVVDDVTDQQRLDDMRRDFVANVSHELKTPVGAMSVLAETLAGSSEPEIVARLSSRLEDEASRLAKIIDDLLDLSRIEGASDVPMVEVVLQDVVDQAVDLLKNAAEQRGVELGAQMPAQPIVVLGDHANLRSAIMNLTENAITYSQRHDTVSIRLRSVDGNAEIVVQDTGIGIPVADHDRIFERFYRVDQARDRGTGGTGLGLSIVRHVILNHGGAIAVDSQDGLGSTFTISLPALEQAPIAERDRL